ncbi:MAG: hypothetical protein WAK67_22695 [Xanthobacteraceae bacterium]|jgi:hypothetical protein
MENFSVTRNAMVLLAIVIFEMAVATHVLAAEHGSNGVHAGGGLQSGHMDSGFHGLTFDRAPSMPSPVFNPSNPYTVPQSPETPVSPASPGLVFGHG